MPVRFGDDVCEDLGRQDLAVGQLGRRDSGLWAMGSGWRDVRCQMSGDTLRKH